MGNKSAWETLAVSKDKQIAALTAEVTRLRALDAALRKISEARDDESTPAAMQRTAEDRTRQWMAEVEKRDAIIEAANARTERAIEGLRLIVALQPSEYVMPKDWHEQINACKECERWKDHPIQLGICDEHRRPLWARKDHEKAEVMAIGGRARSIASDLLRELDAEEGK